MVFRPSIFPNLTSFLIVLIFLLCFLETSESKTFLKRGYSLSVEDDSDLLTSPDKTFTCGFYGLGKNAYWFAIWFTNSKNRTVVWTANRDRPVNGQGSRASLRRNGDMVLTDVDGTVIWITNTTDTSANRAELLDSGNLVLKDTHGKVLWQSFDFPTDTLLPNQRFGKSSRLISRLQIGNFASGYFSLYFDSNSVLILIYDGPDISSVYWPDPDYNAFQNGRTIYNSSRIAVFDDMGKFLSSDGFKFRSVDMGGSGIKRRLTMDYDGNLRLYSLNNVSGLWMTSWQALIGQCKAHGVCGRYGICVYTNTAEPKCTCPPGYEVSEPGNWNKGCKPKFNRNCSSSHPQVKFVEVAQVDYYGFDLDFRTSLSMYSCMKLCLDDCRCQAFSYRLTGEGRCYTKNVLYNGYSSPHFPGNIYLKLPATVETSQPTILKGTNLTCNLRESKLLFGSPLYQTTGKKMSLPLLYWFALAIGAIEALFIVSGGWLLFRKQGMPSSVEDGYRAISRQFRRFSYSELKNATKNFREELGRGASGAVYKGVLSDERVVAVKNLENFYQGEEVFWAEVSTVAKIYHMYLVRMWGFCSEGRHRLVVYEFVENQSLDKHLFSSDFLGWKERFQVALCTAKGLAYLHHECLEWVIHCDVKPENILLDNEFDPKIADFGLSKLSQRGSNNSIISHIRGTKGYMAPEWASNLPITAKVDVYSYGVVILEMVKGIRLSKRMIENNDKQEIELTRFVREVKRKILSGDESWIEEIVDPRLNGNFNKKQASTLVEIGISCVEEDRSQRPTMDSVVQSLIQYEESVVHNPNNH